MAALTSYNNDVANVQSGAIKPIDQTSLPEAIFNATSTGLQALDSKRYNDSLDARLDKEQGLNDIARLTFGSDVTANANVPQAAKDAVGRLDNAKSAVDQGNLPPTAYTIQLQNQTAQVMAAHPEAAYSIMEYMKSSGHNAAMFPALEAQQATQKALQTGYDQSQAFGVDYAQKNGVNPNLPLADQAAYGLSLSYAKDLQQQAVLQATAARENLTVSQTQRTNDLKVAESNGVSAVQQEINTRTNSIFDATRNQISAIGSNDERDTVIQTKLLPALDNAAAQAKASAYNHLSQMGFAKKENIDSVYAGIDAQVAGIKAVFADRTGGLQKTLENLKAQYGIDTAKAAPLLFKYGQAVGNNNVAALLGPTTMMDSKLQVQLAAEWKGIATSGAIDAQTHFNNIVSILNGNTQLKDYTQADASRYIGAIATGKNASERAILGDASGGQDHQVYLNSTSNLLNATHQLTPASSLSSLTQAANLVATQPSRLALDKLATDPLAKEYAASVGMASHLTSIKLLQDFQTHAPEALTRYQSIQYDPKSGQFYAKFDKAAFVTAPENATSDSHLMDIRVGTASRISSAAQAQVQTMNQVLDHAVKTGKYDPSLPKGASPLDVRNAIATGRPLVDKTSTDSKTVWDASEANLENKLAAFPGIIQDQDTRRTQAGKDITNAIAHVESGGDPGAVSPKGAEGTMQVMKNTQRDPGFGVTPAKDNSSEELTRVGVDYFHAMQKRYGNDSLALVAQNWGPGNTDQWIRRGGKFSDLPDETKKYVSSVLLTHALNGGR